MKALIVDDYMPVVMMIQKALADSGLEVVYTQTAKDAIEKIRETSGDLGVILMDVGLPDANGLDTIEMIKKMPEANGVPIVVITGRGDESRARSESVGASAFFSKPFDINRLVETINQIAGRPTCHLV